VAIETFITELSNVIKNWPDAKVTRTIPAPVARRSAVSATRFHHPIRPASSGLGLATQGPPAFGLECLGGGVNAVTPDRYEDSEMSSYPLDDLTADRLVTGGLSPDP
jgi:hypothetical protein